MAVAAATATTMATYDMQSTTCGDCDDGCDLGNCAAMAQITSCGEVMVVIGRASGHVERCEGSVVGGVVELSINTQNTHNHNIFTLDRYFLLTNILTIIYGDTIIQALSMKRLYWHLKSNSFLNELRV